MKREDPQEKHYPSKSGSVKMKSYKQFISESVNISGDFNGTLNINSQPTSQQVGEEFSVDFVWQGSIYRVDMISENGIPPKNKLTEQLQNEYPGAIIHNVYPGIQKNTNITKVSRYHPAKLEWI
jgi:hypothetical protein